MTAPAPYWRRFSGSNGDQAAVEWLLASADPAVVLLTERNLLGSNAGGELPPSPLIEALLDGQLDDGGFGGHPYRKWGGAHWRLVSLVELGVEAGEPRAVAALDRVLAWLTGAAHRGNVPIIAGLARLCASQEGNALAVASRLGRADDPRAQLMAGSLVEWQWPDGGWNCDRRPGAHRSSFHESLPPMWGLHEYAVATGDDSAAAAARRTAELLLDHRLFRSLVTGKPIHPSFTTPHWPPYWHYDVLQALVILARMGLAADPRAGDGVGLLLERRASSGRWTAGRRWWSTPGGRTTPEVVDWSRGEIDDQMVTLRALTVLHAR